MKDPKICEQCEGDGWVWHGNESIDCIYCDATGRIGEVDDEEDSDLSK